MSVRRNCLPVLDCDADDRQGCADNSPKTFTRCQPMEYRHFVGPCDYEPTPFEKAMTAVIFQLQQLGADIVAKYGEASPRYVVSFQTLKGKDVRIQQVEGGRHTDVELEISEQQSLFEDRKELPVRIALCKLVSEIQWRLGLAIDKM